MTLAKISGCVILIALPLFCISSALNAQPVSASPQALTFVYQSGGANPAAQSITLSSGVPITFTVTLSGAPWLTVSPTTGVTPSSLTATVTSAQNLAPGNYAGSVIIGPVASTDATKIVVSVSLEVLSPPQGNLVVSPTNFAYDYQFGGGPLTPFYVHVSTTTASTNGFTLSTSVPWIAAYSNSYVTPSDIQVTVTPTAAMGPGVYTGAVTVIPSFGGGSPQQVVVTLRISASGNLTANPTALSFNYQQGASFPPGQTVSVVNSAGGAVQFNASVTTASGGNWLSVSPGTAFTPGSLVVSVNPGNLGPGTYFGSLSMSPTGSGVTPTQIPITLTVVNASQLLVNPSSLTFNYQSGGPIPPTQYLSLTSTGTPITFAASIQGPPWITINAISGTTPVGLGVSAAPPATVASGSYSAIVTLTPTSPSGSPISVPVAVNVTASNYLTVSRTSVSFAYSSGGIVPPPAVVQVTSSGAPLAFQAVAAALGSSSWLTVNQSSQYTPADVAIGISPQGLAAGTYTGTVVVSSSDATNRDQSISVTLIISNTQTLIATPFGLVFSYQQSSNAPSSQLFVVSIQGAATTFALTTTTASGGNWLSAVGGGSTPATILAAVSPSGLAPGTYSGQIQVNANDSSIPALQVPVVLNVSPGPVFLSSPNLLTFQYLTNGPAPAAQSATINTNAGSASVFYPTAVTASGGPWLSVTPNVSVTPGAVTVNVNPAGLGAGLYYGLITVNDPAGAIPISYIPVSLQIASDQILTVAGQSVTFSGQVGGGAIAPQSIPVLGTGNTTPFHVTTDAGTWLHVSPTDGFTDVTLSVSASTSGLGTGVYLGVISIEIPGIPNSNQYVPVQLIVSPGQ